MSEGPGEVWAPAGLAQLQSEVLIICPHTGRHTHLAGNNLEEALQSQGHREFHSLGHKHRECPLLLRDYTNTLHDVGMWCCCDEMQLGLLMGWKLYLKRSLHLHKHK